MMDMRKHCHTPRDMADPVLLAQLLGESEPVSCHYGTSNHRVDNEMSGCRGNRDGASSEARCRRDARNEMADTNGMMGGGTCAQQNCLSGWAQAMAYFPDPAWENLYEPEEALAHGTLFRALDLPFYPACGSCSQNRL